MIAEPPIHAKVFKARAVLVGERIDLKAWSTSQSLANNPLTVAVKGPGVATLYRYGVVVFFNVLPVDEMSFLALLRPAVTNPYATPEIEELEIHIEPGSPESVNGGVAFIENAAVGRLQVISDVLSKSALLSLYEKKVDSEFDRIEPFAMEMDRSGYLPGQSKELRKKIGSMLLVEQRMVGRAAITEKPDILWDNPGLEGLFVRLEGEFEIKERHTAIDRKLSLIASTVHTVLELVSAKHSLRVEWYIVILILLEILLTLYQLFIR